jgi:hypothetical protein
VRDGPQTRRPPPAARRPPPAARRPPPAARSSCVPSPPVRASRGSHTLQLAWMIALACGYDARSNLNINCMEAYLRDDEFVQLIGMDREAFYQLAQWKRRDVRKRLGLF